MDARGLHFNHQSGERRSRPRFGEPVPDQEEEFPRTLQGVFAKAGAAPNGMIAKAGNLVLVDCHPFTGSSRFPAMVTQSYRQGGDIAALAQPWKVDDATVLVRRQTATDRPDEFSGALEMFVVATTSLPESHILSMSWVNALSGYYTNDPVLGQKPVIVMWTSNRRGVKAKVADADPFHQYLEELSGPISRLDKICSSLDNFAGHVTADQMAKIRAMPSTQSSSPSAAFEGVVVDLKLDHTASHPLVVFVTLWRQVFELRSANFDKYKRALLANTVHRGFYDFERSLFEMQATVEDFVSPDDISNAEQMVLDYVSFRVFRFHCVHPRT